MRQTKHLIEAALEQQQQQQNGRIWGHISDYIPIYMYNSRPGVCLQYGEKTADVQMQPQYVSVSTTRETTKSLWQLGCLK